MEILRFTLSGKQAFFKKPEVNTYYYFTYGHMHKVALMGMLGAILGYGGYSAQTEGEDVPDYPEFYERLKDIKVSMIPFCEKGSFPRKMVAFNNSVGYASQELGGNLIIKQQWLEEPKWYVYIMLDNLEAKKAADAILGKRCVYMPYLGSNDHPADIEDAEIITAEKTEQAEHIDSLFVKEKVQVDIDDYEQERPFKYEEELPYALDAELNMYLHKKYVLTNLLIERAECDVYSVCDIDKKEYHIVFD